MKPQFLLDQCVPNLVASSLAASGFTVHLLKQHLPVESTDPVVIAKATELKCVLVSLNGDFADILSYPPSKYGGIVAMQLRNQPSLLPLLVSRLVAFVEAAKDMQALAGKLFVVEVHRIRVWG